MNTTMIIEGVVLRETSRAIFATISGITDSVWLPKSQLSALALTEEDYHDGMPPMRFLSAEIPLWLWNKLPINQTTSPVTKPW